MNSYRLSLPKLSPLAAVVIMALLLAACSFVFAGKASAHGYIESPAGRALQCKQGTNTNCGAIQYEPQSIEAPGHFPTGGPADGQITGGGIYPELYEQTTTRWNKVNLNGGTNTFTWKLTANHATREWKYYITKANWNPNQALKRSDLELFCQINDGGAKPPTSVSHQCNVPTDRSGYHLILGVWEIADTPNAFYQVIDVNLTNGTGTQLPTVPGNVVSPAQTASSVQLTWSASTASAGIQNYEVYRNGTLVGTSTTTSYNDTGLTANTTYVYTIKAVDTAGNKSAASVALSKKTLTDGGTAYPAWSAGTVYLAGDKVSYNGANYEARWWTLGDTPSSSSAVWKSIN
ncbi:lytic polysaccharide monooxygenase [Paenibacillus sp. UMB4589-SE434]|uniref:lytic polysaccharide monooxygenase n=1 Tax=Paenibacillus sp. UMB4589-SE434 TaxID=3046314 RepID=UPI00254C9A12|nr:lytic polysaccharide monooxygenase [Paenibacillus sp. UMB4589-SE434]MDK8180006.1 lytic polysaccharide monooxygenase [Paenibacillus sp. UMB4589-SE434]